MDAIGYVDIAAFRRAAREKNRLRAALYRGSVAEPRALDDQPRTVRFCFSDGSVDRMGDTIDPAGWLTHSYMKNPVALWAHDSSAPPIGRSSNLMVEDLRLMGDITFAEPEVYPFAETIYRLVMGKFLNAVSVGFLPLEYDWSEDDDREWGLDFTQQELLEVSVCPVPANGNALAEARKSGIDTRPLVEWAEKTLEGGGKIVLPRSELEELRRAAKELKVTKTRARPAPRRRADEDNDRKETQIIGNCGRPLASECGMKDVSECSIHGTGGAGMADTEDEKALTALIEKAVTAAINKRLPRPRREADDSNPEGEDGSRPDLAPDHEKAIRMCSMHMKSMGDHLDQADDYYDKAMDYLDTVTDALDASPPPQAAGDEVNEEGKAALLRRLKTLRARVA